MYTLNPWLFLYVLISEIINKTKYNIIKCVVCIYLIFFKLMKFLIRYFRPWRFWNPDIPMYSLPKDYNQSTYYANTRNKKNPTPPRHRESLHILNLLKLLNLMYIDS